MSRALAAYELCGCCAAVSLLSEEEAPYAYEMAAERSRAGNRIEEVDVDEWKARPWHCADHENGPPWWESNGGDGKRPAEYAPQPSLGL